VEEEADVRIESERDRGGRPAVGASEVATLRLEDLDWPAGQVTVHGKGHRVDQRAIARVTPPDTAPGRYQPPDPLLAFVDSL
jgi:hypothetical protein